MHDQPPGDSGKEKQYLKSLETQVFRIFLIKTSKAEDPPPQRSTTNKPSLSELFQPSIHSQKFTEHLHDILCAATRHTGDEPETVQAFRWFAI